MTNREIIRNTAPQLWNARQLAATFNAQFYDTEFEAITTKTKDGWLVIIGRRI